MEGVVTVLAIPVAYTISILALAWRASKPMVYDARGNGISILALAWRASYNYTAEQLQQYQISILALAWRASQVLVKAETIRMHFNSRPRVEGVRVVAFPSVGVIHFNSRPRVEGVISIQQA